VIHAFEARKPCGRARIEWKLVTDLTVNSVRSAVEKLRWYAQCWRIKLFHKVLKSGCQVEAARLRTAERLPAAHRIIKAWRTDYNTARPHTSLNGLTPAAFATRPASGQIENRLCS
jgi:transposase InsO family protein